MSSMNNSFGARKNKLTKLGDLAAIHAGHPIRGRVQPDDNGDLLLVQLKNVDPVLGIDRSALVRIKSASKKPDLLRQGDVLFVNRGTRFFAVIVGDDLHDAVAAPHFFVLRAHREVMLPEYLAWYLNHKRAQHYYAQRAAGSALPHVSSKILGELPVALPILDVQRTIVAAHDCVMQERRIMESMLDKRASLVAEILDKTLDERTHKGVTRD